MKKLVPFILGILLIASYFLLTAQTPEEKEVNRFFENRQLTARCSLVDQREGLKILSDEKHHLFALLADSIYAPYLDGNRILAFSTTNAWGKDVSTEAVLNYYEQMLNLALRSKEVYKSVSSACFSPFLQTAWGQDAPYNRLCPTRNGQPTRAGCVPVAVAQLIAFHHQDGGLEPEQLIANLGRSMGSRYTVKNTVTGTHTIKDELRRHYGFSASCRLRKGLSNRQLLTLAVRNFQEGRPILLSNREHAFLADGMAGDYLHLNLGIGGACNGFYRVLCVDGNQWELPFATSIFTDIKPETELNKSVHVEKPGTLEGLLGDEALNVTNLEVSGKLNGKDVALIRRMAGAVDDSTDPAGSLNSISFQQVSFVTGDVFAEEDAVKLKFVIKREKETYDFSQFTENRWKDFCSKGYNQTPDYRVVRKNSSYFIQFLLTPSPNSTYFFMDCDNLK